MDGLGIYTIETIFLSIVALWFARQLNFFALLNKINDPQRILPPTIVLFLGLFIIPYLYRDISGNSVILEILKSSTPLTAIAIFFIGRYTAKREKREEKEKEEKFAGKIILDLLQEFIDSDALSKIEQSLNISNPDYNLEEFEEVCKQEKEYFNKKLQEIKDYQFIFNSSYRENIILYFRRVENFFKDENQAQNGYTVTVWSFFFHKYQAYIHQLDLCKNIIKNNSLAQSRLSWLEFDKKNLERLKEKKENIFNEYKNLSSMPISREELEKLECLMERYPYLEQQFYDEGIEEKLIADIDKIIHDYK